MSAKKLTGKIARERIRMMEVPRAPAELIAGFKSLGDGTGIISDIMDELGITGVIGASVAVHLAEPLWAGISLGLCNAAEALVIAGLIERQFGADFDLDRPTQVLGLLLAALAGTLVSGVGAAVTYRLLHGPAAELFVTWQHWFASDVVGIVAGSPPNPS